MTDSFYIGQRDNEEKNKGLISRVAENRRRVNSYFKKIEREILKETVWWKVNNELKAT